jgi:hypothetical protein
MKHLLTSIFILACMGVCVAFSAGNPTAETPNNQLKTAAAESSFDIMMKVLTHRRCVNCHPNGQRPRQGEDSHYHNFNVLRGADNHGVAGLKCGTCHQSENNDYSGVPGAPEWSLAPIEMYWEGLSRTEIARSMMDPAINGGRSVEELVEHLTEHELVLWAWEPGVDNEGKPREKPPVPLEEYIAAVKAWAEAGAVIPDK